MAQPGANDIYLDAGLQEVNRSAVSPDVGRYRSQLAIRSLFDYLRCIATNDFVFSLEPTKDNLAFLFSFVRVLVEGRHYQMDSEELKDLNRAIADLYELAPETRRLATLARSVKRSYGKLLDEWVGDGRLAEYFDHVEDNLSVARFQTFDFEGMDQSDVLEPLLFYILHRANASIYDRAQHAIPKLFVFDEAWRFFRNSTTKAYIHEALKTWRKRNGTMILATQSSNDLLREELLSVIAESCFTKMFSLTPAWMPKFTGRHFTSMKRKPR